MSCAETPNGIFLYWDLFCPEQDSVFFGNAIAAWRSTNSPQPKCYEHTKLAKMCIVKDLLKQSFGRPFFVCSEKGNPCSFWQWGDEARPLCFHGLQCITRKVKKDGANQGHLFYTCSKGKVESCNYFEWRDRKVCNEVDEDPLESFCIEYFSMPPSYKYTVKKTGESFQSHHKDRKQAYAEYMSNKE